MLRMSRLTDYGIVLLAQLAQSAPGAVQNARELAEEAGLPLPVVSKVLKELTREGLLVSQRGTHGGYGLARPPEEISVARAIAALEGPIALTECSAHPGMCQQESSCQVRTPWQRINRTIHETLDRIRLSDLARPPEPAPIPPQSLLRNLAPEPDGRAPAS